MFALSHATTREQHAVHDSFIQPELFNLDLKQPLALTLESKTYPDLRKSFFYFSGLAAACNVL